jgi:hypothetical protein
MTTTTTKTQDPLPFFQLYREVEKTELRTDGAQTREEIAQRRIEMKKAMDLLKRNTPRIRHMRMR